MVEATNAIQRQDRQPWQFTLRGLFVFTFSVALGLSFWKTEHDWHQGFLAAISFWIVLGLAAQVRDIWRSSRQSDASTLTPDQRWGWRFAFAWRLAVCCLIAAYFLDRWLITWQVLAINDRPDNAFVFVSSREVCEAALLTLLIVAIASSPRFAKKGRRPWSRAVDVLGVIAGGVIFVLLLVDRLVIPWLVHITINGIQNAWPLKFSADTMAAYSPARISRFFDITTMGVVSVLASCGLLRLLSLWWRRGGPMRTCLGLLLVASLIATILLAGRIALVEVPGVTPVLAATIFMPTPHQLVAAAVLVLALVSAVAHRWSEPPSAESAAGGVSWRRDEERYHHERRLLLLLLGGILLTNCVVMGIELFRMFAFWFLIESPVACLSLALAILAMQGVFLGWSKRSATIVPPLPRLSPALFLVIWSSLLTIVVCSAPILGAWGFALWLKRV